MPSWNDVAAEAPDLAARVQARFASAKHHTLATLRHDGSPRISGTEVEFKLGEAWLGSMHRARKALDLLGDPRFALHSSTADETLGDGDARIGGVAVEVDDEAEVARVYEGMEIPPGPLHLFRLDVRELVLTRVQGDDLVVDWWRAGGGARQVKRR